MRVINNLYQRQCFGDGKTENFMTKFYNFGFVTFHLPDDKNLMKLNVSKRYLTTLEESL